MMKIQELMQSPYAWAILSFCTISAFLFAIYTWIVGKKKKEFSFFGNTFVVVKAGKNLVPRLDLTYDGKAINNLTITKFAIWNSGTEVINNSSDIVAVSPLQILCKCEAQILDAQIILQTEETNQFKIGEIEDNYINICFDYANVNDGIIIQVLHTGEASDITVDCKIKGGKKLKNLNHNKKKTNFKHFRRFAVILMGLEVLLALIVTLLIILYEINVISIETLKVLLLFFNGTGSLYEKILLVILIALSVVMLATYITLIIKEYNIAIPSKLRKDIEYDTMGDVLQNKENAK